MGPCRLARPFFCVVHGGCRADGPAEGESSGA
jgi:hypothetical protein